MVNHHQVSSFILCILCNLPSFISKTLSHHIELAKFFLRNVWKILLNFQYQCTKDSLKIILNYYFSTMTTPYPQKENKPLPFPTCEELIAQIKDMDEEIMHVSLNLVKCDFDATEDDVKKTFPDFSFIKVKNYNPGSFEIVLEMKIDAIHFIRQCFDRTIRDRRFFIKLGRQYKDLREDWIKVIPGKVRHCLRASEKIPKKVVPLPTSNYGSQSRRLFEGMKVDENEDAILEKEMESMDLKSSNSQEGTLRTNAFRKDFSREERMPERVIRHENENDDENEGEDDDWNTLPITGRGEQ